MRCKSPRSGVDQPAKEKLGGCCRNWTGVVTYHSRGELLVLSLDPNVIYRIRVKDFRIFSGLLLLYDS